ncbi:DciA family protein [Streptomyces alanosinicus]
MVDAGGGRGYCPASGTGREIDDSGRLHVRCSSPAWRTQVRMPGPQLTARVNELLAPQATISGVVV